MTKEKKSLLAISTLMQVIFTFFDIFFSIYVLDISQNINLILIYNIVNVLVFCLILICTYKFLSEKVLSILYKLSFVMGLITILLTFTISADRIYMIFITQIFLKFTQYCYYMPHEVATMNSNKRGQMGKFIGLSSTLSLGAGFISPLLSGFVIDNASITYIFIALSIIAVICFILSFNIDIIKVDKDHYGMIKFLKGTFKVKGMRHGYIGHSFFKLSNDVVVTTFLPILIYFRTGTNFSVGLYSGIASLVSGIVLILYCYFCKNKQLAMWVCTIFQVIASFAILIWSSLTIFFFYYFVKKITGQILQNGSHGNVFSLLHNTEFKFYAIENFYAYNFYNAMGNLIGCVLSIIFYNLLNNEIAITILLALVSLTQIVSTALVNSSNKLLEQSISTEKLTATAK